MIVLCGRVGALAALCTYSPEIDDAWMWRAQPGAKTRRECESEMKEFQQGDPGREYRIEYHCLPDTTDARGAKGR